VSNKQRGLRRFTGSHPALFEMRVKSEHTCDAMLCFQASLIPVNMQKVRALMMNHSKRTSWLTLVLVLSVILLPRHSALAAYNGPHIPRDDNDTCCTSHAGPDWKGSTLWNGYDGNAAWSSGGQVDTFAWWPYPTPNLFMCPFVHVPDIWQAYAIVTYTEKHINPGYHDMQDQYYQQYYLNGWPPPIKVVLFQ